MKTELEIRKDICEVGKRLYLKNLVAATDGNISVKIGPDRFLCTPSGVSKYNMNPNEILIADGKGTKLAGQGKVTSEFFTHLAAYEERKDMYAVVHAHPPRAVGFTLAGVTLADCVLPEVVYTIGGIPTASYATPASKEGSEVIRDLIRQCDALVMDRHGAVTIGVDVYDALFKMEKIEHAAESLLVAHLLGNVRTLDADQVRKLQGIREAYGVSGRAYTCHVAEYGSTVPQHSSSCDLKLDRIIEDTLTALGESH
jgi:L-fuculose-phosphate aldolase